MTKTSASKFERVFISYDPQKQLWKLYDDYDYTDTSRKFKITVKKNSRYDLSSVPRIFWKVVSPFDLSNEAPLIHDYLYVTKGGKYKDPKNLMDGEVEDLEVINGEDLQKINKRYYTRQEADLLFRQMMEDASVKPWRIFLGYWAVKLANIFTKWD